MNNGDDERMKLNVQEIEEFVKKYAAHFDHPEDDWHFVKETDLIMYALKRIKEVSQKVL